MRYINVNWQVLAVAAVVAALAGCNDDTVTVPAAQVNEQVPFSVFANEAFSQSANSTPVAIANINFDFDVNNEPTAFNPLLMQVM